MVTKKILFILLIVLPELLPAQIMSEPGPRVNEHQQAFGAWLQQKWRTEQSGLEYFIRRHNRTKWNKDRKGIITLMYGFSPSGLPDYLTTTYTTPAAMTIGANNIWESGSSGLNLSGNNSVLKNKLALWDGGRPLLSHVELSGRINAGDTGAVLSDHSTAVAGIIMDKAVNPDARGMAYGLGGILSYDFYNDVAEMAIASPDLLFSNHSYVTISGWNYRNTSNPIAAPRWEFWGDPKDSEDYNFGYYGNYCRNVDSIVFNAPFYTIVKAAGNNRASNGPGVGENYWRRDSTDNWIMIAHRDSTISSNAGYDIIPTFGNAKNILTVGSIYTIPLGYTKATDVELTNYSSWGPTDDGRIKPDIVAPGQDILSASAASDSSYILCSGTSACTPVVTGSLVLLQQLQYNLTKQFLHASTLKALVIHTANEAGSNPGPDYMHGWGLLNVEKAAAVISNKNLDHLVFEKRLLQGIDTSFKVIAAENGPLTFTLCWTDPPGDVDTVNYRNNRALKLVNDLDMTVSDGNTLFLPWCLDVANPSLPAVQKNNSIDNVEKIDMQQAIAGKEYTITIRHKGVLRNGFQDYSFVASGINGLKTTVDNPFGLIVLPNPARNYGTIRFKPLNSSATVITITNINGQRIKQETIYPTLPITNYTMDISALSKGVYIIQMLHSNVETAIKMEKL